MIEIKQASERDAWSVAVNMRTSDATEIELLGGMPEITAMKTYQACALPRVVLLDGTPAVLYGVNSSAVHGVGVPWMVATDAIRSITREFVRGCRNEIEAMQALYPRLTNITHRENRIALRWLEWMGFEIARAPAGPGGAFFVFRKGY